MTRFRTLGVGAALALCAACGGSSSASDQNATKASPGGAAGSSGSGSHDEGGTGPSGDGGTSGSDAGGASATGGASGGGSSGGTGNEGGASGNAGANLGGIGGAAGAVAGGASGSAGAGGSGGSQVGVVEEPESPCNMPGVLACAGNHQRVTLVCSGGTWQVNDVCAENQACDSTPGFNQGSCREIVSECAGHEPGYAFCSGPTTLQTCGPDNVTIASEEVCRLCSNGMCSNDPECPAEPFMNCGEDCGELSASCWSPEAQSCLAGVVHHPGSLNLGERFVVRTPDYAGTCPSACPDETRVFTITVLLGADARLKVTVPPPWRIANNPACLANSSLSCQSWLEMAGDYVGIDILTNDPTAPEHNVVVEAGAPNDSSYLCP